MKVRVTIDELNTRAGPNSSDPAQGKLLLNQIVEISEIADLRDGWYRHQLPDGRWIQVLSQDGKESMVKHVSDDVIQKLPLFWQRDPKWASARLGLPQAAADSTIDHYGCRLCCWAMILNISPDELQRAFCAPDEVSDRPIFYEGPLHTFNYIDDARAINLRPGKFKIDPAGRVDCISTSAPIDKVDALLAVNGFVMAYVNATKNMRVPDKKFREHWILITAKLPNDNYEIHDPYMNDLGPLSPRYGRNAAEAICGFVEIDRV